MKLDKNQERKKMIDVMIFTISKYDCNLLWHCFLFFVEKKKRSIGNLY